MANITGDVLSGGMSCTAVGDICTVCGCGGDTPGESSFTAPCCAAAIGGEPTPVNGCCCCCWCCCCCPSTADDDICARGVRPPRSERVYLCTTGVVPNCVRRVYYSLCGGNTRVFAKTSTDDESLRRLRCLRDRGPLCSTYRLLKHANYIYEKKKTIGIAKKLL